VHYRIEYAHHYEHASNDSKEIYNKLEDVFSGIRVVNAKGVNVVVDHQNVFI